MKIKNQTFAAGEVVELDGNTFEGCTFSGCHMVFRGLAMMTLANSEATYAIPASKSHLLRRSKI
jgi:hypothetical protein